MSTTVRAKAFVQSITRRAHSKGAVEVTWAAVSQGDENKTWSQWTPVFNLTMTVKDGPAAETFRQAFEDGTEFYVDFTPAS